MQGAFIKKYFFAILLLVSLVFGVLLFWPFLTLIVLSVILSVVFSPVYRWFLVRIKSPSISSLLTVLVFVLVLCIPAAFVATMVFNQAQDIYQWLITPGSFDGLITQVNTLVQKIVPGFTLDVRESLTMFTSRFTSGLGSVLSATLTTIFSFILVLLSMFYFLKDGPHWQRSIRTMSPLSKESTDQIALQFEKSFGGIIKGYLLVGLVQGFLTALGLWIFGIPNAILWGVFAAIASLIPSIGPAIIPVPVILFLVATGNMPTAIGFSIYSIIVVGGIDNMIQPYFVGKSINIHPITALFGVLGGIALMGPLGIIIGPLIISFIQTLLTLTKKELQFS